jgi:nucleotide-binding universal stress UspA family protein
MKTYTHVVIAIDFTPSCRNALRQAVRLASKWEAALTAVHVMDEFLVHELKRALSTDQATIREEWLARLARFVEETEAGPGQVKMEVRVGSADAELMEVCLVVGADLIILGARGSREEPNRVGAIASKCLRKAPIDVLLVREDAHGPFKHLVACVDFSDNSKKAIQIALNIADLEKASLDCIHVYQSAISVSMEYGGFTGAMPTSIDAHTLDVWESELTNLVRPLQINAPAVSVKTSVIERVNIREAVPDHVKESHADLVVLGTRGKSGLRELIMGTTAERIVAYSPCSVFAIKPDLLESVSK